MPSRPVHDRIYYHVKWQIYEVFLQYWALHATLRRDHDATIWCLLLVHICCLMFKPTLCACRHAISTCTRSHLLSCEVAGTRGFPCLYIIGHGARHATLRRDHDATIWCLLLVHICCLIFKPTLCACKHAISTCTRSCLLSCEVADIRSFPSILSLACNSSARPRCDHLVPAISAYILSDV